MKILHTSDWHLGIRLNKTDLSDQARLFIDWLEAYVRDNGIECILHAGDIFDTKYPPQDAIDIYHDFLMRMYRQGCRVIAIAGNHDSGRFVASPRHLVAQLGVFLSGTVSRESEDEIFLLKNRQDAAEAVVCAVPFIRQGELAAFEPGMSREELAESIITAIRDKYQRSYAAAIDRYPALPVIGMGHLTISGAETSDIENQVYIGNIGGLPCSRIDHGFSYIALGHIHRAQGMSEAGHIRYSGSPVCLSFSEINDKKSVTVIDISEGGLSWEKTEVPLFRRFIRWKGSPVELIDRVSSHRKDGPLKDLAELIVVEDRQTGISAGMMNDFLQRFESDDVMIVKTMFLRPAMQDIAEEAPAFLPADLEPRALLSDYLGHLNYEADEKEKLLQTFDQIVIELNENQ